MTIDVLAFATSPRRHGNSETLLDWVLAAMEREGETAVEKIVVPEVDIRPCRGCNACEMLNRCVQRDDMDYIHDRIIAADCIILASPIYCMGLAAQAKVLVDRAQVFRSRKLTSSTSRLSRLNGKGSESGSSSQPQGRPGTTSLTQRSRQ